MYGKALFGNQPRKENVNVGDIVRISNVKGDFAKGYHPNWSEEHFVIRAKKDMPGGKRQYFLKEEDDANIKGENLQGAFNKEEIQRITKNRYRIKVLKSRKVGRGRKEYFVEWIGWPAKYNSWISQAQLTAIKGHGERV